jgi:hypothetical protein
MMGSARANVEISSRMYLKRDLVHICSVSSQVRQAYAEFHQDASSTGAKLWCLAFLFVPHSFPAIGKQKASS